MVLALKKAYGPTEQNGENPEGNPHVYDQLIANKAAKTIQRGKEGNSIAQKIYKKHGVRSLSYT